MAGDHAWYYEGRNGWWQYDERTSRELEDAFSKGKKTAEMLIAGFLYVADLENMVQYRRNEHGRRRKMKRDILDIPKKGVAGLRLDAESVAIGGAGRENSADGADTSVAGAQQQATSMSAAASAAPPARPPTSLDSQPGGSGGSSSSSPALEDALSQLQISLRPAPPRQRSEAVEGEEVDEEASPSRSSEPQTSVDESGSGDWSDDEEEDEDEEEEEEEEPVETSKGRPRQQRLNAEDRAPPGAESVSPASSPTSSSSSSGRSRMPDGQCTVTEV